MHTTFTVQANLSNGDTIHQREKVLGRAAPWKWPVRKLLEACIEEKQGCKVVHIRVNNVEIHE